MLFGTRHNRNLWKVPQRGSIGKPHNHNHLGKATNGLYWETSQQEPLGKNFTRTIWQLLDLEPVRNHSKGFCWNTSQPKSFGQHYKGTSWKVSQHDNFGKRDKRDSIGKRHNCNTSNSTTHSFYCKASQLEPIATHHKGILLQGPTIVIVWKTLRRNSAGKPQHRNPLENATKELYWRASQLQPFQ